MALKFWLPLDKTNEYNRGIGKTSSTSFTSISLTSEVSPSGKKCSTGRAIFHMEEDEIENEFTISVWGNYTGTWGTGNTIICCKNKENDTSNTHWYFSVYGSGQKIAIGINGASAAYKKDYTFAVNTWYHLVATYNGQKYCLYVNGALAGSGTCTNAKKTGCLNIGVGCRSTNAAGTTPSGSDTWKLSDFRVYDNALTEQDIKELYWSKVLEFTPQWIDGGRTMDASGVNFPLTPHNITVSGNLAQFNGTSSYIDFDGINISGGTVSIWFTLGAKPTTQRFLYYDPVAKMTLSFASDGTLHPAGDGSSQPRYQTTSITWGQLTNVIATWSAARKPTALYINGVKPGTGKTTTWTTGGTVAAIGSRRNAATGDYFNGSINSVQVYAKALTADEAKELYDKGPNTNSWDGEKPDIWRNMYLEYSGCTWLKVLHHNAPATNLFTTANRKNNDDENLFSRLGLFDDTTMFKMTNGKYQFMVREKLESTSTENIGIWTQTSSPTASAIAGYTQIYSSTGSWPRSFGLTHQSANAVFDESGSGWWCACGCSTAYQGGIPGFWGNVKTGYIDLYIRVDDTQFFNNMG